MSAEDDDYGWDDPEPIVEIKNITLTCRAITSEQIQMMITGLATCLDRKIDKLNLLLKSMNVYECDGQLIVNDRYGISHDFYDVVHQFGMDIAETDISGLKGKTYIVCDRIKKLLEILGYDYRWDRIVTGMKNESFQVNPQDFFTYQGVSARYGEELQAFLREIRKTGCVHRQGKETFIDGVSQGVVSDVARVEAELQRFAEDIRNEANSNNKHLQYGTTELLYARARQMGYSVEKTVSGSTVQLVLVRNDA